MGQFEKIVVLSVIGLIAVILVVSFSGSQGEPLAGGTAYEVGGELVAEADLHGPLPEGPRPIRGRPGELASPADDPARAPAPDALDLRDPFADDGAARATRAAAAELDRSQLTLSAEVLGAAPEAVDEEPPIVEGLPAGAALVTLRGLEDTWEPDLKQYACRPGDALRKLARRFYGDADKEELLRQYNEGVELLQENQILLVPVFDLRAPAVEGGAPPRAESTNGGAGSGQGAHVVGEGENLWGIAVDHYGKGSEWQRIYDANRDRLSNPDALRAGMTLRIP